MSPSAGITLPQGAGLCTQAEIRTAPFNPLFARMFPVHRARRSLADRCAHRSDRTTEACRSSLPTVQKSTLAPEQSTRKVLPQAVNAKAGNPRILQLDSECVKEIFGGIAKKSRPRFVPAHSRTDGEGRRLR